MQKYLYIAIAVLLCLFILLVAYTIVCLIIPIRRMKKYADAVAKGQFDAPLPPVGKRYFGMFSDGFNMMREEVAKTREREAATRQKGTELMAQLAKDLQSSVNGIRLTSELVRTRLLVRSNKTEDDKYAIEKLDSIFVKAEEIDDTLYDMLASAQEDLGQVMVVCSDVESQILADFLKKRDEMGRVVMTAIPDVLIHIDNRRMSQVIGNIISNSYKYANTSINVGFLLTDHYLQMKITDHGPGVPDDEIALITDKYYRGRMWADSTEGRGLGLYTAAMLMEKMEGKLLVENTGEGLCVTLMIKLS